MYMCKFQMNRVIDTQDVKQNVILSCKLSLLIQVMILRGFDTLSGKVMLSKLPYLSEKGKNLDQILSFQSRSILRKG